MDPSSFLSVAAIVVGLVVGVGGLVATVWAVAKVKGVETSIDILNSANEGLRDANADLHVKLNDSERHCAERISRLEGQNQALLDGLGGKVAEAIATRLEKAMESVAQRIVDNLEQRSTDRERRFGTHPDTPPT